MAANLKKIVFASTILLIALKSFAQDPIQRFALGIEVNRKTYNGELGKGHFNWTNYNIQLGASAYYYLNPTFDAGLSMSYGPYGFKENINSSKEFDSRLFDPTIFFRLKLDNGLIIKQHSAIGPYLKAGLSYNMLKRNDTSVNTFNFMNVPVGIGLKFKLVQGLNLILESTYNFNFNDEYDGNFSKSGEDKYWNHKIGIVFGLGSGIDGDNDEDGIKNSKDRCPGTPKGITVDEFGCPKITVKEQDEVKLIAKGIYFETNSAVIKTESYEALDRVVFLLKKFPGAKVNISGHTDNVGTPEFNFTLSQNRANAVKQYLTSNGIKSSRIIAKGFGETLPLESNDTPEGRAINRRVEFLFTY